jgi:hypothetical protein|eukprot:3798787-Prymnesium_polylepis.1
MGKQEVNPMGKQEVNPDHTYKRVKMLRMPEGATTMVRLRACRIEGVMVRERHNAVYPVNWSSARVLSRTCADRSMLMSEAERQLMSAVLGHERCSGLHSPQRNTVDVL